MTARARQGGVVLASNLAFVLAMTAAALAAGNVAALEQQMARNLRDGELRFAAAESAIAAAMAGKFNAGVGRTVSIGGTTVSITHQFEPVDCDGDEEVDTGIGRHHFNIAAGGIHQGIAFCAAQDFSGDLSGASRTYWRRDGG